CREKIDALFRELEYETAKCSLSTVLTYVTERIVTDNITPAQYVTTDTMLQNCEGIRTYDKDLPSGTVIRFQKGDILLSNIRPYLRKLWFADFDGGCSPDVLVFRSRNEDFYSGRYIFYAMRHNEFFDFVMQNVNGIKMPRGNKEHIMRYKIPAPSQIQQKKFLDAVAELEAEISEAAANLKGLAGKKEEILKKHLRS
ncbi:MAG: hypothetical protein IJU07_00345, partial [Synergistaceae bacterium]|nr:hypothetical protein [Synergistaceae bacterium]